VRNKGHVAEAEKTKFGEKGKEPTDQKSTSEKKSGEEGGDARKEFTTKNTKKGHKNPSGSPLIIGGGTEGGFHETRSAGERGTGHC